MHPSADLAQKFENSYRTEKGFEVLEFAMPDNAKKNRCIVAIKDPKTKCCVVVFRKVGFLSNFSESKFVVGNSMVDCSEIAFLLFRLGFTMEHFLEKAKHATDIPFDETKKTFDGMINTWNAILTAPTPAAAKSAAFKTLPTGVFTKQLGESWDAVSWEYMLTVLLMKFSQNDQAFNFLFTLRKYLTRNYEFLFEKWSPSIDEDYKMEHICFVETEDTIWGSGRSNEATIELLVDLPEISPTSVADALKEIGAGNKLGLVFNKLVDVLELSGAKTADEFAAYIHTHFEPIYSVRNFI
jgi:predicted NAD-dependent protein-ADP-ribosyltransferase YbiA (DUF1768 family)